MQGEKKDHSLRDLARALFALMCFLVALDSLAFGGSPEQAKKKAPGVSLEGNRKDPIFITSDQMEVDRKKNTISYKGSVVTKQGEMTMQSQTLTATYNPDMKRLQGVVAEGKVQVSQGDRVATGTRAVFNDEDQTITLTGNPVIRQGNSQVSGARITFFVEEDRVMVEGGTERVRATVFPDELKGRESGGGRGRE
jgi:lipopolysaccharide export system protein LptA